MLFKKKIPPDQEVCNHKFEARYDEVPSHFELHEAKGNPALFRTLLFYNVYVKDICVKCGKEIKK